MQTWGVQSHYDARDSAREPSKSGVIGLLCAALGRPRTESLADLTSLRMGVRVDREGTLQTDFQTTQTDKTVVSRRHYLSDAVFLVGLEGSLPLLENLQHALQHPKWLLFLGRKAFPPAEPICLPDGLRQGENLLGALSNYPSLVPGIEGQRLRLVIEDPLGGEVVVPDVPVSFAERRYLPRRVHTTFIEVPEIAGGQ
jgi:CRISPR system Cascade subunit CasD